MLIPTRTPTLKAEELPIPASITRAFSAGTVDPLQMYAAARLMAFGVKNATGHRVRPWQRKRMARGANMTAQGRLNLFTPAGG